MKPLLCVRECCPPEQLFEFSIRAEQIGIDSIWVGEHHNPYQSSNPLLAASVILTATRRIKVVVAGLAVRYYAGVRIAFDLVMLSRLFGSRITLGFVRSKSVNETFHEQIEQIQPDDALRATLRFCRSAPLADNQGRPIPDPTRFWLCGSTEHTVKLAAELNLDLAVGLPEIALGAEKAIELALTQLDQYRTLTSERNLARVPQTALWVSKHLIVPPGGQEDSPAATFESSRATVLSVGSDASCVAIDAESLVHLGAQCSVSHIVVGPVGGSLEDKLTFLKNLYDTYTSIR